MKLKFAGLFRSVACVLTAIILFSRCHAQTTQGMIAGRVLDSVTGAAVRTASVNCKNEATGAALYAPVDANGNYAVPSLSPGLYTLTIRAAQYQTQQARALDLPVAGRIDLIVRIRPLYDVWESGQFRSWIVPGSQQAVGFYGPDVDPSRIAMLSAARGVATPLGNARSDVISSYDIEHLPLTGRDVYTMLLLLPGVASDTATARGLGFSANGQRPSSSNYLLDGVENNNLLVTGPLSAAVPEFIQEYRVSTTNYSAEYGRTSGFVANAITRSGTNQWHGKGFFYLGSDRLNANGFQENANGIGRPSFTQIQPGVIVSAPLIRNKWFLFAGFQAVRMHGRGDPQVFALPTASFINSSDPNSYAGQLLRRYKADSAPTGPGDFALASVSSASTFNRIDGLLRTDYALSPAHRLFGRIALDSFEEPELLFNPYRDFSTGYSQKSISIAAGLMSRFGPSDVNEFRAARTGDSVRLQTPHAEVPTLIADDFIKTAGDVNYRVALPGSASIYDYVDRGANWEALDNWTSIKGRHALKVGGGFLQRATTLHLSLYPEGYLEFATLADFAQNKLAYLLSEYDQLSATRGPVSPGRSYRYRQAFVFAQDSFRVSERVTFDYGIRYEYFGSPLNVGAQKDILLRLGAEANIQGSLSSLVHDAGSSGVHQVVYTSRPSNWAARAGFAWMPAERGRTILRGSYGIFYDRPFDNLWQNLIQNRYQTGVWRFEQPVPLPSTVGQLQPLGTYQSSTELIPALAFQPYLRAPRTHSAYIGLQEGIASGVSLELDVLASRSSQLITTDEVNRPDSLARSSANPLGRLVPSIDNYINYRANQGSANYAALVAALRFRRTHLSGQVSYTWSHSVDNQSEPLAGTFIDFNSFGAAQKPETPYFSSFTQQFASSLDRGNSDFDQRHNLVLFGTYQTPAARSNCRIGQIARDWTVSALGAIRSGLPFSVYAPGNYTAPVPEYFVNQRADLLAPDRAYVDQPVTGGRLLLNPGAFGNPAPNRIGTSGRNAFTGPGLFNLDASIARTFLLTPGRESLRATIRADFYNLLNHANLNNPESFYGTSDFGVALYGRRELNSAFPLLAPLNETARQVQILVRLEF